MRTAHDIIAMLPDDVRAEVIAGRVIVSPAVSAGRHARIVLAVRRAFARRGIGNLFENTTLLVEHDEEEYVPDLARWPEQVIDGDSRPAAGDRTAARGGAGSDSGQITAWVAGHFTAQAVGGSTVYDLTAPSAGSAS